MRVLHAVQRVFDRAQRGPRGLMMPLPVVRRVLDTAGITRRAEVREQLEPTRDPALHDCVTRIEFIEPHGGERPVIRLVVLRISLDSYLPAAFRRPPPYGQADRDHDFLARMLRAKDDLHRLIEHGSESARALPRPDAVPDTHVVWVLRWLGLDLGGLDLTRTAALRRLLAVAGRAHTERGTLRGLQRAAETVLGRDVGIRPPGDGRRPDDCPGFVLGRGHGAGILGRRSTDARPLLPAVRVSDGVARWRDPAATLRGWYRVEIAPARGPGALPDRVARPWFDMLHFNFGPAHMRPLIILQTRSRADD